MIAGEEMTIQLPEYTVSTIEMIDIISTTGEMVDHFSSIENLTTASLDKGVYFVNIKTTKGFLKPVKLIIK